MRPLPNSRIGKIEFVEQHLPVWKANADQIGITSDDVKELEKFVKSARGGYEDAKTARNESRAATQTYHDASNQMNNDVANLIKAIRAFAEKNNDPDVFAKAQIPAPAPRRPLGPPQTPTDLVGRINGFGQVVLNWKTSLHGRPYFVISRRLAKNDGEFADPSSGEWQTLGTVQEKTFTDTSVPTGFAFATYRLVAHRGTLEAPDPTFTEVPFGSAPGSNVAGTIGDTTNGRQAA